MRAWSWAVIRTFVAKFSSSRARFLEPCALLGSGDGKDVLSLNEEPGARQLGWRAVLLSRHCPDLLH